MNVNKKLLIKKTIPHASKYLQNDIYIYLYIENEICQLDFAFLQSVQLFKKYSSKYMYLKFVIYRLLDN